MASSPCGEQPPLSFFNLYRHNFVRVAVAIPEVRVADPAFNGTQTIALMREAADKKALLAVFPELGLSAYSCEDLFHQQALLDGSKDALQAVLSASRDIPVIAVVGMPLRIDSMLFNCAVVLYRGRVLGAVPKTYLPNYREFYELRQFTPGDTALPETVELPGQKEIPFGSRLLFQVEEQPLFTFHLEICEDLWVPIPPSSYAALAGATVLINFSASNVTVGKDDYRRQLVTNQSGRCLAAYIYSAAGVGESTTDLAWDGHGMISENGTCVAETARFTYRSQLVTGDIDLDRIAQDRMRQNSFAQQEAIALLPSFLPDLVLTDLRMPRLDGIGVLDHVKNVYPTTPVIIFTADTTMNAERTAKRLGAQDYINKPLNFDDLLARVACVFNP